MIVEGLFTVVVWLLNAVLDVLDVLPAFPAGLVNSVSSFFDLLFDNMALLGFFVRMSTVRILAPLVLIVVNFEHIYSFIMWILRKIPFVSIE